MVKTMNLLETAMAIALEAHEGAATLSGRPYILHPLHIMLQMDNEEEMITAVLHDVVEDSSITLGELAALGFSDSVLNALELLTHDKTTEGYEDYILALKPNPLARRVKLADLTHNMDIRRLPFPISKRDLQRLEVYRHAWEILNEQ